MERSRVPPGASTGVIAQVFVLDSQKPKCICLCGDAYQTGGIIHCNNPSSKTPSVITVANGVLILFKDGIHSNSWCKHTRCCCYRKIGRI